MTALTKARRLVSALACCERGTTAIEFGLIGTMVISLSVGIVQVGLGLQIRNDLARAMDVGAREVLLDPNYPDGEFQEKVGDALRGSDKTLLVVPASQTQVIDGTSYRVFQASYPFTLLIPGVSSTPFNISVSRRVPAV